MKIKANLFSRTTLAVACSALLVLSGCEAGNIEGEIDGGSVGVDQLTPEDGVGDAVGQDVLVDIAQEVAAPDALTDCGDGERSETEACDDGNLDSGDGCDPTCQVEPGWACDLVNCFCDEGFFGEACLPCPDCGVHGACRDGLEGAGTCDCETGYAGELCDTCDVGFVALPDGTCGYEELCRQELCNDQGDCVADAAGEVSCDCDPDFLGDTCDQKSDECDPNPCQNDASCEDGVAFAGAPECLSAQFDEAGEPVAGCATSAECQEAVCDADPYCCNQMWDDTCAACAAGDSSAADCTAVAPVCLGDVGYTCECPEGFTGDNCEEDFDYCEAQPCLNGAECVDGATGFTCECAPGWEGDLCDEDLNECAGSPCANGGLCENMPQYPAAPECLEANEDSEAASPGCPSSQACADAVCDTDPFCCEESWDTICVEKASALYECSGSPGYACVCPAGYQGWNCEDDIDECAIGGACETNATCTNTIGGFECECGAGFEIIDGQCEDVDECAPAVFDVGESVGDALPEGWIVLDEDPDDGVGWHVNGLGQVQYSNEEGTGYPGTNSGQLLIDFGVVVPGAWIETKISLELADNSSPVYDAFRVWGFECPEGVDWAGCASAYAEGSIEPTLMWSKAEYYAAVNAGELDEGEAIELQVDLSEYEGMNVALALEFDSVDPYNNDGSGVIIQDLTYLGENPLNVCADQAECVNGLGDFQCICNEGYGGDGVTCEDLDECALGVCQNDAGCENSVGSYECFCDEFWTGTNCDEDVNECAEGEGPCVNGGTCDNLVGEMVCQGASDAPGCVDEACQAAVCEFDPYCCAASWDSICVGCAAGGEGVNGVDCSSVASACVVEESNYMCSCPEGWTGKNCEEDIDECADGGPCSNLAECVNLDGSYECQCPTGWSGELCDQNINECEENAPCENGSVCSDLVPTTYYCQGDEDPAGCTVECADAVAALDGFCANGWDSLCSACAAGQVTGAADCSEIGDVCVAGSDGAPYMCECLNGWEGMNCELNTDECALEPCANDRPCIDLVPLQSLCQDPSGEVNCTEDCVLRVAEFDSYCANGWDASCAACAAGEVTSYADCTAMDDSCTGVGPGFTCECGDGWLGDLCETDIDECADGGPCQQGAACLNLPGSYECDCDDVWDGKNCEENKNECVVDEPCANFSGCEDLYPENTLSCQNAEDVADGCTQECRDAVGVFDSWCLTGWDSACVTCAAGAKSPYADCTEIGDACGGYSPGYVCSCAPGWTGDHCEDNVDECADPEVTACYQDAPCTDQTPPLIQLCQNFPNGSDCSPECNQAVVEAMPSCSQIWSNDCRDCATGEGEGCEDLPEVCMGNGPGFTCECPEWYGGHDCSGYDTSCIGSLTDFETATNRWALKDAGSVTWRPSDQAPYAGETSLSFSNGVNYDNDQGAANGSIHRVYEVPQVGNATLNMWVRQELDPIDDGSCTWDVTRVFINGEMKGQWCSSIPEWTEQTFDLSMYGGQSVDVKIEFHTGDDYGNNGAGLFIDNISLDLTSSIGSFDEGAEAEGWEAIGSGAVQWIVDEEDVWEGTGSLHFANEFGTFENGESNAAGLLQKWVDVPAKGIATLHFAIKQDFAPSDQNCSWDVTRLYIGPEVAAEFCGDILQWEEKAYDLSAYAGESVLVRFAFDSLDHLYNANSGVHIDGARIDVEHDDCKPPKGFCGDGVCGDKESFNSCEQDCEPPPPVCGDGVCNVSENFEVCPDDCEPLPPICGDGVCDEGENFETCLPDCEPPKPPEPPFGAVCEDGVTASDPLFDAGFGPCETYVEGGPNANFCVLDGADIHCPVECGTCPDCFDDPEFDAGFGPCETYVEGGPNADFCVLDGADVGCPVACNTCPPPEFDIP